MRAIRRRRRIHISVMHFPDFLVGGVGFPTVRIHGMTQLMKITPHGHVLGWSRGNIQTFSPYDIVLVCIFIVHLIINSIGGESILVRQYKVRHGRVAIHIGFHRQYLSGGCIGVNDVTFQYHIIGE